MYEKQGFYSGQPLTAAQLNTMEEGIIAAQSGGGNIEMGRGDVSTQQMPRTAKVNQYDADENLCFTFVGNSEAGLSGLVPYGAVGNNSASFCGRSSALGSHSMAVNSQTVAQGDESMAVGYATTTIGSGSFASGSKTVTIGEASHTEGEQTVAEGKGSHAEGSLTRSVGKYSHAEGYDNTVTGLYSHVEGSGCRCVGDSAHAEGNTTIAGTNASHAEGANTRAVGCITVQELDGLPDGSETLPGEGGVGGDDSGEESIDEILKDYAACAHVEGNNTIAMMYGAHAEGVATRAFGHSSHAEGFKTQTGDTFEEQDLDGKEVYIANPNKGMCAHAEGYLTRAIGNHSHAEGENTLASGQASYASGIDTEASGYGARAVGYDTKAVGTYSSAEGYGTLASGDHSHASGFCTIANQLNQTVVGQHNNENVRSGSLFVVGAGPSSTNKINGLEVLQGGEIVIYWEGAYYSLNNMLNLIANAFVKSNDSATNNAFFKDAKK